MKEPSLTIRGKAKLLEIFNAMHTAGMTHKQIGHPEGAIKCWRLAADFAEAAGDDAYAKNYRDDADKLEMKLIAARLANRGA